MKKWLLIAALLIAAFQYFQTSDPGKATREGRPGTASSANTDQSLTRDQATHGATRDDDEIARAFREHHSNLQVASAGTVARVLADDNDGSRHQRFLLKLASGQTLLIAHNIDIAPALKGLRAGDAVSFNGEYEWNERGGVIHWTHRDPAGRHVAGWLKHNGVTSQ